MTLDNGSQATEAQGINPKQHLTLIDPRDEFLGLQLPRGRHPTLPQMPGSMFAMMFNFSLLLCHLNQLAGASISTTKKTTIVKMKCFKPPKKQALSCLPLNTIQLTL